MKEKTSSFFKENWFKLSILIVGVVFLGWIFVRPAIVKQQCSMVTVQKCAKDENEMSIFEKIECEKKYKNNKREATDEEYEICLRKYGL